MLMVPSAMAGTSRVPSFLRPIMGYATPCREGSGGLRGIAALSIEARPSRRWSGAVRTPSRDLNRETPPWRGRPVRSAMAPRADRRRAPHVIDASTFNSSVRRFGVRPVAGEGRTAINRFPADRSFLRLRRTKAQHWIHLCQGGVHVQRRNRRRIDSALFSLADRPEYRQVKA